MQLRARYLEQRTKVGIGFLDDANRVPERASLQFWKVLVRSLAARVPVVPNVVGRVQGIPIGRTRWNMCYVAMLAIWFTFNEIPKGD
jgi:hypothetical protein